MSGADNGVNNTLDPEMEFPRIGKILQHLLPGESALDLIQPGVKFFSGRYGLQHSIIKIYEKFTVGFVSHDVPLALRKIQVKSRFANI
jgi:hypothetical protein